MTRHSDADLAPEPTSTTAPPRATPAGTGQLQTLRRHWRLLLLGALASAALAWWAAERYTVRVWQAQGAVLYAPPALPRLTRATYAPPSAPSVVGLLRCRAHLEKLCDEFHLACTPEYLDRQLKVTQTPNSEVIEVSLEWPDPDVGAAMLNRLFDLHARHVADLRREHLGRDADALAALLADCRKRVEVARTAHDAALAEAGSPDLVADRERLDKELTTLEGALAAARDTATASEAEATALGVSLASFEGDPPPEKEDVTSPIRMRRDQLQELARAEELRLEEARRQLGARERELATLAPLLAQRSVSELEVSKVREEASLYRVKVEYGEKALKEYRDALAALPREAAEARKAAAAAKAQAAEEKARLARNEVKRLEARRAERQERADKLADVARRLVPLNRRLDEGEKEQRELVAEAQVLDQARRNDQHEMTVVTPAASHLAGSSKGRIVALTFSLPMLLLAGGVLAVESVRRGRSPHAAAERLGLPVVARRLPGGDAEAQLRRVGLRLCERVGDSAVVMLTAAGAGKETDVLAAHLARYLALRGDRILLVDAHVASPRLALPGPSGSRALVPVGKQAASAAPTPGLLQLLLAEEQDSTRLIVPTEHPAIDLLPAGAGPCGNDLLASRRMLDLLDQLRGQYTRIVVLAPPLQRPLETELLMPHVDAAFVTLGAGDHSVSDAVADLVRSLDEAGAPLVGTVIC